MFKIASRAAIAGALLAAAGIASATTTTTATIDAQLNSVVGGSALDTGLVLTEGDWFGLTATGTWQNDPDTATWLSDANGHATSTYTLVNSTGSYEFKIGELVGEIGDSGVYFAIGASYSGFATSSGDLNLVYWDSDAWNNSGAVTAAISAVPEPANVTLIALGLGAFALSRRRKA